MFFYRSYWKSLPARSFILLPIFAIVFSPASGNGLQVVDSNARMNSCDGVYESSAPAFFIPNSIKIGDSPQIKAIGLTSGKLYKISASMTDTIGRRWESSARFAADQNGIIDVSKIPPKDGSYSGTADEFGLLWSMKMLPRPKDSKVPKPPMDFNTIGYKLSMDGSVLATASTRQWVIPSSLKSEKQGDGLVGEIFSDPISNDERPGILLLGGSGGGMTWARRQAALLADEGYVAMALAYFNAKGLEKHLAQIPLEYVDRALDKLIAHPRTDRKRIAIVGYSKGAELALLMGTRRQEVTVVVAFAPGSAVFQGFKPPKFPTISSWSLNGKDLPFVPNAYDKNFFETFDGMYLWYRTLNQYDKMITAAIPIEKINGRIFLISGAKDTIWPSTLMSEQMVGRLRILGLQKKLTHRVFGLAGHGIAAPPGEPLTRVAKTLGGTPRGNAVARREGWIEVKEFLSRELAEKSAKSMDK